MRELNGTINHSYHETPSQTYDDSKVNGANIEVRDGRALWSDEVDSLDSDTTITFGTRGKEERGNM